MKVYSVSQKKLIDVPDTETTTPVSQTQSATLPKIEMPQTTETPQTITGHTLQEHAQALNQAKAVGDTDAIKSIQDDYDREYQYQKDLAPSATDIKNKSAYQGSLGLLDVLEQNFTAAKGGEYTGLGALIAGTKKNIAGKLNLDKPAGIYNREKSGFTANLKTITGDTGVMTQKDYDRIESLLPKFTDDPQMAAQFFKDMRQIIANKFGGVVSESKYQMPEIKGGLLASITPKTAGILKNVGDLPKIFDLVKKEIAEKGALGAPSSELRKMIGGTGVETGSRILNTLSDAYNVSTNISGAAGEITTPLIIAGSIKRALPTILNPRGAISTARDIAAQKASGTISSKPIVDAINNYVEKDPLAKSIADKLLPSLEDKTFTVTEALDRSELWNQAYTAAGKVGKSERAGLYNVMTRAIKLLIKDVSPEVAAQTGLLRATYVLPKIIGGIAGAGATLFGLDQLRKIATGQTGGR